MKTFTEGGRGRKQCPDCKVFVSARAGTCVCGHEFQTSSKGESGGSRPLSKVKACCRRMVKDALKGLDEARFDPEKLDALTHFEEFWVDLLKITNRRMHSDTDGEENTTLLKKLRKFK